MNESLFKLAVMSYPVGKKPHIRVHELASFQCIREAHRFKEEREAEEAIVTAARERIGEKLEQHYRWLEHLDKSAVVIEISREKNLEIIENIISKEMQTVDLPHYQKMRCDPRLGNFKLKFRIYAV